MDERRISAWSVLALCAVLGCGATTGSTGDPSAAPIPSTEADPPPYVPAPTAQGQAGTVAALATSGSYDQARAIALRFVIALRDEDQATLERLLADRLGRAYPRLGGPWRERDDLIRAVLHHPRRAGLGADTPMERLIDLDRLTVRSLRTRSPDAPPPTGLDGSDLIVTFPLAHEGRRYLRMLLGWPNEGSVVVRAGPEPLIVAL